MKHPAKIMKVGDQVEAVVLDIKPKDRRISLGVKQLEADPWTTVADRYAITYLTELRGMELAPAPIAGTRVLAPYRFSVPTPIGTGTLQANQFISTAQ